eukprot:TRINITY_DN3197_c0_g1_i2.p1 TRINITY_DN3197_c0_g1~~TRINITY_DN3197_c0_g1_i2.p1  ORF type:complete len:175 (-),score=44.01 TRINITY_DN3197_c0_g1_i2:265-789(-)
MACLHVSSSAAILPVANFATVALVDRSAQSCPLLPTHRPLRRVRGAGSRRSRFSYGRRQPAHAGVHASTDPASSTTKEFKELFDDVKRKWDAVEDKSTVAVYAGGCILTLWLSSAVVSAVNAIPILPKVLELIGAGYSAWFVYRYLLFESSRKEIGLLIEDLKAKVTGAVSKKE